MFHGINHHSVGVTAEVQALTSVVMKNDWGVKMLSVWAVVL
jgi:hypothetical protein